MQTCSKSVRIARSDDFDVVRNLFSVHSAIAYYLLEQSHAVAGVHFVKEDDDSVVTAQPTGRLYLFLHPRDDVSVLHAAVHVQRLQRTAEHRTHVADQCALATARLSHDDHRQPCA